MEIFDYYVSFLESAGTVTKYKYTDKMRLEITHLLNYFSRKSKSSLNKDKGIILMGSVGQGKTLFFETVKKIIQKKYQASFLIVSAIDIITDFEKEGHLGIQKYINSKNLVIDDLGTEKKEGSHYANKFSISDLIELRYQKWLNKRHLTHVTSNLNEEEIEKRLGERANDRLNQMSQPFKFEFMPYSFRKIDESTPNFSIIREGKDLPIIDKGKVQDNYLKKLETFWKPRVLNETFSPMGNSFGIPFYDLLMKNNPSLNPIEKNYDKNKKGLELFKKMCKEKFNFLELK